MSTVDPDQPLSAKTVLRLYAAGERNFRGAIIPGENFCNANLSKADFTGADIRGAVFVDATLQGTNFSYAKAGVPRFWQVSRWLALIALALPVGYMQARTGGAIGNLFARSDIFSTTSALISLVMAAVFGVEIGMHGFTWKALRRMGIAAALVAIVAIVLQAVDIGFAMLLFPLLPTAALRKMGTLVLFMAAAIAQGYGRVLLLAAMAIMISVTDVVIAMLVFGVAIFCTAAFDLHAAPRDFPVLWALVFAAASLILALYIRRTGARAPKFASLQVVSLLPVILWGTNFSGADLRGADFTGVMLKGVNFSDSPHRPINLTNVRWQAEQLRQAYFGRHRRDAME